MHSDALEMRVDRGEQPDYFYFAALTEQVEGPRTIFSAAPREKDLSFQSDLNSLTCERSKKEWRGRGRPRHVTSSIFTRGPVLRHRSNANWWRLSVCRSHC